MPPEQYPPAAVQRFGTNVMGLPMRDWHAVAVGALAMACASVLVHAVPLGFVQAEWGDNAEYISMADHLLAGEFKGYQNQFAWGYPAVMAMASRWIHVSTTAALTLVSVLSALGAIALASWLWGPRVAATFGIVNFAWIQRATFGGTDSLYMLLLLLALACVRHNRWMSGTAIASLSVLVRPVGIFVLPAIFIVLAARRQYRALILSLALVSAIGIAYYIPVSMYIRDPLLFIQRYREDWYSDWIVTFPLGGAVAAIRQMDRPLWSTAYNGVWLAVAVAGFLFAFMNPRLRAFWKQYPVEWIFGVFYLSFILSYNSYWVWAEAARLVLPAIPFLLATIDPWLPRQIWVYAVSAPLLGVAAGIPVIGVGKIISMIS